VDPREYEFDWDDAKAEINFKKHGVSFSLASTIFFDPGILTVPDLEHSGESEDRWISLGIASSGSLLAAAHLWLPIYPLVVRVRLISARRATPREVQQYQEGL
jgi:uncharacterized DUF497 family protein